MKQSFKIADKEIGGNAPCFIIAELSANHNHNFDVAIKTIIAAKNAGADAIKLQTYTADTLTIDCSNEYFQISHGTLWDGKTLYDLYKEAYTPWEWHSDLMQAAKELELICFSSPFDSTAVDFLEKLNVPAYKIASFEIFDIPLIKYAASKGKPMILSTGMAKLSDIEEAVQACYEMGNTNISLLKCTSAYPSKIEESNLLTIQNLGERFNCVPGLSDHTLGILAPVVSIALGCKIIEKHFILDQNRGGPDAEFSLNPVQFKEMVDNVRLAEKALGGVSYELSETVEKNRKFARSLFVVEDIAIGELFTQKNIRSIRPGYGLAPKHIEEIIGKAAKQNIKRGTPLNWEMIK